MIQKSFNENFFPAHPALGATHIEADAESREQSGEAISNLVEQIKPHQRRLSLFGVGTAEAEFPSKCSRENADLMLGDRQTARFNRLEVQALGDDHLSKVALVTVTEGECAKLLSRQGRQALNQSQDFSDVTVIHDKSPTATTSHRTLSREMAMNLQSFGKE